MNTIETERLILRHIVESDAEDIFEYAHEPNVGIAAGWAPHKSIEETRSLMGEIFIGQDTIFGIVLKESNKMIGTVGLLPDPHRQNPDAMMLGYAMGEKYWGKGLMTEASKAVLAASFAELPLDLISCTCYSDNHRSRRVIEKCGFKYTGYLYHGEKRYDGVYKDVELFSMTK